MKKPALLLTCVCLMAACTKTEAPKVTVSSKPKQESAQSLMVRVAKQVQACWFKRKDPALVKYRMAAEINSFSGKPRILIVPRNKPTALPKLVAQAQKIGGQNRFESFGPLLQTSNGPRLNAALNRWASGSKTC
jgi:hypothetical protein